MQKLVLYCIAIILMATTKVGAQDSYNDRARKYIDQYASLAMTEQRMNGIPAAVTLGQGILETEAGISELMTQANNHFGIKCKNGWLGETFTHTDDAPNECFKKYKCAAESYSDHTHLLKTNPRYAPLFSLKETDYAGWARCLKKCGYATNPQYAQKLIKIIEDFGLQKYTYTALDSSLTHNYKIIPTSYTTPMPDTIIRQAVVKDTVKKPAVAAEHKEPMRIIISHDRHTVKEGETLAGIAQMEGVDLKTIMDFNFLYPGEEPIVGTVLELQKQARQKPKVWVGAIPAHKSNAIVSGDDKTAGQDGDYIDKTKIPATQPPAATYVAQPMATAPAAVAGSSPVPVNTRHSRQALNDPAPVAAEDDPQRDQELAAMKADLDKVVYADDSLLIAANATMPQIKPEPRAETAKSSKFYTVRRGDTAFSIAKKNNITVNQLMKWNDMEDGTVKLGQTLRVKE